MTPALLQYLASVNASMAPAPPAASGGLQVAAPPAPVDLGAAAFGAPPPAPIGPPPPPAQSAAPPPTTPDFGAALANGAPPVRAPGMLSLTPEMAAAAAENTSSTMAAPPPDAGPTPAQGTPAGPAGPPDVQAPEHPFPLVPVGGSGIIPAHEVDLRGPTLTAQQGVANAATESAINANTENTQSAAGDEYRMYLDQARQAQQRQAAADQAAAERDEELQQRAQDFDQSVKALSKLSFQPDGGFWASRTTPRKLSAIVSIGLGGFLQGATGGRNPGLDMINTEIDREVRAQEFAWQAGMQSAQAKQTAFGLAMQKYNNVDAARAMARAAAIDGVQAQIAAQGALWKDADAANRANAAMAELENQKTAQVAQGIKFVMPQATGRQWMDQYGVTYNEAQARTVAGEMRSQENKREDKGLDVAGQLLVQGAKEQAKRAAKGNETQQSLDATLAALDSAQANVKQLTSGGYTGKIAGEVGLGTKGAEADTARENYNRRAWLSVASAYKLSADTTEPRNRQLLEHFAAPYTITPRDSPERAKQKIEALRNLIVESASAKGAQAKPTAPEGAEKGWGP